MFSRVLVDSNIAHEVIGVIKNSKVDKMKFLDSQKTIKGTKNTKYVRLDVLMHNKKNYYNLEMQNRRYSHLPKRTTYYRARIISHLLSEGDNYEILPKVHVIFICNFDFYQKGKCIYTFDSSCNEDRSVVADDKGVDIYVSIKNYENADTEDQRQLFKYFCTNKPTNKLTRKIHKLVEKINADQIFRSDYMKYMLDVQDITKIAEERGKELGEKIGEKRGEIRGKELGEKLGEKRGRFIQLLELAEDMLDRYELEEISKNLKLQIEYVVALNDGCTIESIVEQINWD